jgi:hypothetical protein
MAVKNSVFAAVPVTSVDVKRKFQEALPETEFVINPVILGFPPSRHEITFKL